MRFKRPDGTVIEPGKFKRALVDFCPVADTALPASLASDGTATVTAVSDNTAAAGSIVIATPATSAGLGQLRTSFTLRAQEFDAIYLTVESLRFPSRAHGVADILFGINGTGTSVNGGVAVVQANAADHASMRFYKADGTFLDHDLEMSIRDTGRRSLTLALYPRDQSAILLTGDQELSPVVRDAATYNTVGSATVRPRVAINTADSAAHSFTVRRFKVEAVS